MQKLDDLLLSPDGQQNIRPSFFIYGATYTQRLDVVHVLGRHYGIEKNIVLAPLTRLLHVLRYDTLFSKNGWIEQAKDGGIFIDEMDCLDKMSQERILDILRKSTDRPYFFLGSTHSPETFLNHNSLSVPFKSWFLKLDKKFIIGPDEILLFTQKVKEIKEREVGSLNFALKEVIEMYFEAAAQADIKNIYEKVVEIIEYHLICQALKSTSGNQIRAAALLGINRNTLRTKINKMNIQISYLKR